MIGNRNHDSYSPLCASNNQTMTTVAEDKIESPEMKGGKSTSSQTPVEES